MFSNTNDIRTLVDNLRTHYRNIRASELASKQGVEAIYQPNAADILDALQTIELFEFQIDFLLNIIEELQRETTVVVDEIEVTVEFTLPASDTQPA